MIVKSIQYIINTEFKAKILKIGNLQDIDLSEWILQYLIVFFSIIFLSLLEIIQYNHVIANV